MTSARKYRKKPIEVDAIYYSGRNAGEIYDFMEISHQIKEGYGYGIEINIYTLEGKMKLMPENYLIKGIKGEFYPCRKDIFEQTYETENEEIT